MRERPRIPSLPDRRTLAFFALAYALTWMAWLPMLLRPDEWQALHYVGSLGPLVAAFTLTATESGRRGVADLLTRMVRLPWGWVLLAATFPAALYALGVGLSTALGAPVDLGDFLGSKEYADVGWRLVLIEILFFGYGEEVGWRGYALEALQRGGRSAYVATTWLGGFWALWHLPLFFYPHGLATLPPLMIPGWLLSILFGAYLTTWVYLSSGRSIAVAAIFHGAVDLVSITPASTAVTLVVVNAGLIAAAVAVVVRYQPGLDRRQTCAA